MGMKMVVCRITSSRPTTIKLATIIVLHSPLFLDVRPGGLWTFLPLRSSSTSGLHHLLDFGQVGLMENQQVFKFLIVHRGCHFDLMKHAAGFFDNLGHHAH